MYLQTELKTQVIIVIVEAFLIVKPIKY